MFPAPMIPMFITIPIYNDSRSVMLPFLCVKRAISPPTFVTALWTRACKFQYGAVMIFRRERSGHESDKKTGVRAVWQAFLETQKSIDPPYGTVFQTEH